MLLPLPSTYDYPKPNFQNLQKRCCFTLTQEQRIIPLNVSAHDVMGCDEAV